MATLALPVAPFVRAAPAATNVMATVNVATAKQAAALVAVMATGTSIPIVRNVWMATLAPIVNIPAPAGPPINVTATAPVWMVPPVPASANVPVTLPAMPVKPVPKDILATIATNVAKIIIMAEMVFV